MNSKKVIASTLVAGAVIGGASVIGSQAVNATSSEVDNTIQQQTTETKGNRPQLSEEKKAEIKAKLESMTEEEKQAWREAHQPKSRDGSRREKPANMTDEEWEQKKAEIKAKIKEKLANMTEEEKQAWLESHGKKTS